MSLSLRSLSKFRLALLSMAVLLSGCALAPGMYFDHHAEVETATQPADEIKPVFKKISAQLIQEETLAQQNLPQADLSEFFVSAENYRIGAGDYLTITVWDHPELIMPISSMTGAAAGVLPQGYSVSAEGKIQFPYAGDINVAGLTELEAKNQLVEQLAKFIKKPEVTLRVATYRSQQVYVDGEVKVAGMVAIDDLPTTLPYVLGKAGGVTNLGDQSRVVITRNGKTYSVNLPQMARNSINPSKILLRNGDLVRVAARDENKVFVLGEVNKPGALVMANGRMSLNAALGEAGGVNPLSGDGNEIYVVRNANDKQPLVYHLDGHSPVMFALAENFELHAKDVVYVDAAAMVRFNRVLGLILPLSQEVTYINRGFK